MILPVNCVCTCFLTLSIRFTSAADSPPMHSVCDSEPVVVPSYGRVEGYVYSSSSQSVSFSMPSMLSPLGTFKVYGDTGMICLFSLKGYSILRELLLILRHAEPYLIWQPPFFHRSFIQFHSGMEQWSLAQCYCIFASLLHQSTLANRFRSSIHLLR